MHDHNEQSFRMTEHDVLPLHAQLCPHYRRSEFNRKMFSLDLKSLLKRSRPASTASGLAVWAGASGRIYEYYVKPIHTVFEHKQIGNLIICRQQGPHWHPLFIAQGDIDSLCAAIIKNGCVLKKNATHIHERLNPIEQDRINEVQDLIRHYPGVFAPGGCMARPARET